MLKTKLNNNNVPKYLQGLTVAVISLLITIAFKIHLQVSVRNVINYIVFAVGIFLTSKLIAEASKRNKRIAAPFAVAFSAFLTFGNFDVNCKNALLFAVTAAGFFFFFYGLFLFLFSRADTVFVANRTVDKKTAKKLFWCFFGFLIVTGLVPRMPTFLASVALAIVGFLNFFTGVILSVLRKHHRQRFETELTIVKYITKKE